MRLTALRPSRIGLRVRVSVVVLNGGEGLGGGPNKNRGDQIIRVILRLPEHMNDTQRKLWDDLAAAYKAI